MVNGEWLIETAFEWKQTAKGESAEGIGHGAQRNMVNREW